LFVALISGRQGDRCRCSKEYHKTGMSSKEFQDELRQREWNNFIYIQTEILRFIYDS